MSHDLNAVPTQVVSETDEVVVTLIPDVVPETVIGAMRQQIFTKADIAAKEAELEAAKEDLRDTGHFGEGWRLDFGRKLNRYRPLFGYGKWIDFVEDEFGLHRMTACRWIKAALKADSLPEDKEVSHFDVLSPKAEEIQKYIQQAQE